MLYLLLGRERGLSVCGRGGVPAHGECSFLCVILLALFARKCIKGLVRRLGKATRRTMETEQKAGTAGAPPAEAGQKRRKTRWGSVRFGACARRRMLRLTPLGGAAHQTELWC